MCSNRDSSSLLHDCSILDKVAQVENIVIIQVEVVLEQAEVVMNHKDWLTGAEVKNDNVAKWSDKLPASRDGHNSLLAILRGQISCICQH